MSKTTVQVTLNAIHMSNDQGTEKQTFTCNQWKLKNNLCYFYSETVNLHKQKQKLSRQISHKNLDKSRVKFRSRVRVQQQRHMTETRNNYQDVHDVTQLEMSLTTYIK